MNEYSPTFFLVKNRALGDSIMGLASVRYLRSLFPKSTIIYAIPQWTAELYQNISTEADLIYPLKMDTFNDILNLYTDLINLKVDCIHELHQSGTGRKVFSFFSLLNNIPYTAHNHHLSILSRVIDQGIKKELIQRDLDGIYSYYGKKIIPNFLDFEPKISIDKLNSMKSRIILGVVATRETKMWSLENYLKLSQKILNEKPDYEIAIPLSKSIADLEIKKYFEANNRDGRIKILQLSLKDLPQFFAESALYIGNDTGLKHIAVATKIKSITLFGPEPIKEWHPYNQKNHIALFKEGLMCRTRTQHYCGLNKCNLVPQEYMQCMQGFTVDFVFEIMTKHLWN